MSVDYSTPVGQVRGLIPDVEEVPNVNDPYGAKAYLFTDEHLESLLALNAGNVRLAAADACEVLGTSEAYIAKVVKTEDLMTNGAALMGQFLQRARQLRSRADDEEMENSGDFFEVIPYVTPKPNRNYWFGSF